MEVKQMKLSELRYIVEGYCSSNEIEITEEEIEEAVDSIAESVEFWEEYNSRCGIYSVNVDILLDNYFEGV